MITVTFDELRNNFDKYVDANMNGEKIVIAENGKEFGMFEPSMYTLRDRLNDIYSDKLDESKKDYNRIGAAAGAIKLSSNFDEVFDALDAEIAEDFGVYADENFTRHAYLNLDFDLRCKTR